MSDLNSRPSGTWGGATTSLLPIVIGFLVGVPVPGVSSVSFGLLLAAAVFPVVFSGSVMRRCRFLIGSALAGLASGVLTLACNSGSSLIAGFSSLLARQVVLSVVGLTLTAVVTLYVCREIGVQSTAVLFGSGAMVGAFLEPASWGDNPWKYAFAFPLSLLVLATAQRFGLVATAAAGGGLALVSLLLATRNTAGALLVAILTLLLSRVLRRAETIDRGRLLLVGVLSLIAVLAIYDFVIVLSADGVFGAELQRTAELQASNSAPIAGRVEYGATWALFASAPLGLGLGAIPSLATIDVGKAGLSAFGVGVEDDYVNRSMFGTGFEVHSIAGDLWVNLGIGGIALSGVLALQLFKGLRMAFGVVSLQNVSIVAFVAFQAGWDLLFSPLTVNFRSTGFALGVCLTVATAGATSRRSIRWSANSSE